MFGGISLSAYFIKKDSEYYSTRDIFNDNGMLLLRRGQKITESAKIRLERLLEYSEEKQGDSGGILTKQSDTLTPITKELAGKMSISDGRILEKPNQVLINIIFYSKTEPWWIYVNALGNYVDWLYTHSIDVAMISLMMAVELGYSDEELTNLGIGTLLHDVGKLLVPKSIIQNPGNLTEMEMTYIRQHCELGMISLKGLDLPEEYIDVVMQHHERLDGSGYPKGLKDDEIDRNAKIAMVADVVDSITSYRPYRQAQTMDTAIMKLRSNEDKYPQELVSLLEKILNN